MAISKQLQKRIRSLTGQMTPGLGSSMLKQAQQIKDVENRFLDGTPIPSNMRPKSAQTLEFRDVNRNGIEDRAEGIYRPKDLELIPPEGSEFPRSVPMPSPEPDPKAIPRSVPMPSPMPKPRSLPDLVPMPRSLPDVDLTSPIDSLSPEKLQILKAIEEMQRQLMQTTDPDEAKVLSRMIETSMARVNAPLGDLAARLAGEGTGEDIQLIHAKPNEVVLPEEFFEDEEFEGIVERKFKEFGINPEVAVVGSGIASLNATTGLEEFGFFKKIFKGVKKVVKKVAPIALPIAASFVPGLGPIASAALKGAAGGVGTAIATGGDLGDALKGGLFGAGLGSLGGFVGTKTGLIDPNMKTIGYGSATGDGFFSKIGNVLKTNNPGITSLLTGRRFDPNAIIEGPYGTQLGGYVGAGLPDALGRFYDPGGGTGYGFDRSGAFMGNPFYTGPSGNRQTGPIRNLLGGLTGGGGSGFAGGLGNLAKTGLIGLGAYKLGKLAFDEAKDAKGVPLVPLTTMDAAGRYDIEAEIARRMGQSAPNPVEFGLLPAGTIPELSGGMAQGGAVMPMAYAEGGGVAMEDFQRMNGEIDGPGTETSDDIPAMLSDGEFVMTGRAVRGAGAFDMQNDGGIITLTPSGTEDRERGTNLMYDMMSLFESQGAVQ